MVTLHEGKQFIINNDHIASAEEAAKLSEEAAKKRNTDLDRCFQNTITQTIWNIWKSSLILWVCMTIPTSAFSRQLTQAV